MGQSFPITSSYLGCLAQSRWKTSMWIKLNLVHTVHSGGGTTRRCVRQSKFHTYFVDAYQANISALKKLEPNFWIELESSYRERIIQRKALYAAHGAKIMDKQEGTELACRLVR
jgi:hypothetical protein